jgi:hypothetical protein
MGGGRSTAIGFLSPSAHGSDMGISRMRMNFPGHYNADDVLNKHWLIFVGSRHALYGAHNVPE